MLLVSGTVASVRILLSGRFSSTIRSINWKYSSRIWTGSRALGSDQIVDASAEIFHDEILLGRRLAVIDFLRPLLERQLDAKGLVDGEGDIEEIEAVDAEIVDGVALRGTRIAGNIARFRDDFGHGIEG